VRAHLRCRAQIVDECRKAVGGVTHKPPVRHPNDRTIKHTFIVSLLLSVHVKRTPVKKAVAGQSACFALNRVKRECIRKGMALLHPSLKPKASVA
jgi:translation elongation factor EF-Tu-like GTPase